MLQFTIKADLNKNGTMSKADEIAIMFKLVAEFSKVNSYLGSFFTNDIAKWFEKKVLDDILPDLFAEYLFEVGTHRNDNADHEKTIRVKQLEIDGGNQKIVELHQEVIRLTKEVDVKCERIVELSNNVDEEYTKRLTTEAESNAKISGLECTTMQLKAKLYDMIQRLEMSSFPR